MEKRLELHAILETMGAAEVYFQPPPSLKMTYPAIVYSRDNEWAEHASNVLYAHKKRYQVTVIDSDPDSPIPDKVRRLPLCSLSRHFVADNLNQDVFNIYY